MTDASLSPGHEDLNDAHVDEEHHPTENQYWVVFVALSLITAAEVAWSYLGLSGPGLILPLVVMMTVKFFIVAGVFMHLYFDLKILNGKYFTLMFGFGLVIAIAVFAAVVASFDWQV